MDFTIKRVDQQIIVKLKPSSTNDNIETFCMQYRQFLEEAIAQHVKLRVLFDLSFGSIDMLTSSAASKLKEFFGEKQMHNISEHALQCTNIVVPSTLVAMSLQKIIETFPGTVPIKITSKHPSTALKKDV